MAYRSLLVACLVAAGCQAQYEAFAEERERLDCEIDAICNEEEAMCDDVSAPKKDKCVKFHRKYADACLDDRSDWLRRVEDDADQCDAFSSDACNRVLERTFDKRGCEDIEGRPLREAGVPLMAEVVRGEVWGKARRVGGGPGEGGRSRPGAAWPSRDAPVEFASPEHAALAGRKWLELARYEHASIAAFARVSLDLLGLGAPPQLIEDCHRAALDEVEHAKAALAVARALLDEDVDFGPLPLPSARTASLREVAVEALVEGCIGEATAAARAEVAAGRACAPIATVLRTIAADETRHAALGWATVRWALQRDPSLMPALLDALDEHRHWDGAESLPDLPSYGLLSADEHARIHRDVIDQILTPILRTMQRQPERSARV